MDTVSSQYMTADFARESSTADVRASEQKSADLKDAIASISAQNGDANKSDTDADVGSQVDIAA